MAIDAAFDEMCTETIIVYPQSSMNNYGRRSFSASGTSYQCRLVYNTRLTRDSKGREVVEAGRAIIYGTALTVTDLSVTRPSTSDSQLNAASSGGKT